MTQQPPQPRYYWDGTTQQWRAYLPPTGPFQYPQQLPQPQPRTHVSGLTTGAHIAHGLATVLTCGLWAPIWFLAYWLGRRRIR